MNKSKIKPPWRLEALQSHLDGTKESKYTKWDASDIEVDGFDTDLLEFENLSVKDNNGVYRSTVNLAQISL